MWLSSFNAVAGLALLFFSSAPAGAEFWQLVQPEKAADRGPHILLVYDMEGLSGQDDVNSANPGDPLYPKTRQQLTDDVNAVIAGLIAGGAKSVTVLDGHGGGAGTGQIDILADRLDKRARLIDFPGFDRTRPGQFDGVALVGAHAKTGSGGFTAHTWTFGTDFVINGHSVSEAEILSMEMGDVRTPVIFVSGDDVLAGNLRTMPWIEYVAVKRSTGLVSAELFPVKEAHQRLKAGARRAMARLPQAMATQALRPVRMTIRAFPPGDIAWLEGLPGLTYKDQSVSFVSPDFNSAWKTAQVVGTAAFAFSPYLNKALEAHPAGNEIMQASIDLAVQQWAESERREAQRKNPGGQATSRPHE